MTDRDKVIKDLQYLISFGGASQQSMIVQIASDALTLLEEQERKGEWIEVDEKHDAFDCSLCDAMVGRKCLFCPGCGAKMKNGSRVYD